jgi:uncharacterized repeat protein (TIGR04052 family)
MRVSSLALVATFVLAACNNNNPTTIGFSAQVGDQPFDCGQNQTLGSRATTMVPLDFRLYVSEVQLRRGGQWVDAVLSDNDFQHDGIALLDFETTVGGCDNGSVGTHTVLDVEDATGDAVAFTIGLPAEQNHLDATTQAAPLNIPSMFWSWADGYKYTKIDVRNEALGQDYYFHLGASDCSTDEVGTCVNRHEGRVEVELDLAKQSVAIDLAAMWSTVDLAVVPPEDDIAGCMSFPDDAECPAMLGSLGLQFRGQAAVGTMTSFRAVDGVNVGAADIASDGSVGAAVEHEH